MSRGGRRGGRIGSDKGRAEILRVDKKRDSSGRCKEFVTFFFFWEGGC